MFCFVLCCCVVCFVVLFCSVFRVVYGMMKFVVCGGVVSIGVAVAVAVW